MVAHAMANELRCGGEFEIALAGNEQTAIELIADCRRAWFRIFLDLEVPGSHGLSLAKKIVSAGMGERCCIVSATDRPEIIREAERLGLMGYIVKACPYPEFRQAVDRVVAGLRSFPARSTGEAPIRLSWRQEQLLNLVRHGLTSREIAQRVCLSEGTVNNCITGLLSVMGATSRGHAVAIALELGLLPTHAPIDAMTPSSTGDAPASKS